MSVWEVLDGEIGDGEELRLLLLVEKVGRNWITCSDEIVEGVSGADRCAFLIVVELEIDCRGTLL